MVVMFALPNIRVVPFKLRVFIRVHRFHRPIDVVHARVVWSYTFRSKTRYFILSNDRKIIVSIIHVLDVTDLTYLCYLGFGAYAKEKFVVIANRKQFRVVSNVQQGLALPNARMIRAARQV
jgi:hypothetical protein